VSRRCCVKHWPTMAGRRGLVVSQRCQAARARWPGRPRVHRRARAPPGKAWCTGWHNHGELRQLEVGFKAHWGAGSPRGTCRISPWRTAGRGGTRLQFESRASEDQCPSSDCRAVHPRARRGGRHPPLCTPLLCGDSINGPGAASASESRGWRWSRGLLGAFLGGRPPRRSSDD
jgi:hypothetical protein